jgi:HAD superfamily hydrolase (TIGR01490 family)
VSLALFDLDHTLLSGDSDVLWCDFLLDHGLLDEGFRARNAEMERRYDAGTVTPQEFCGFFASTLAGRGDAFWAPWRERFLVEQVRPRIPADAHRLLARHRSAGDTLVLTTATNRLITELTAAELGIAHLLATELEQIGGTYTGQVQGLPNMREGKVVRLKEWLAGQGWGEALLAQAVFYSDSINDLPLLRSVATPVAVDPDDRLRTEALREGWTILELERGP